MDSQLRTTLVSAISRLLKPLVTILIRNGISYPMTADILKRVYIDVSESDFKPDGNKKVSAARVSLLTGIHRKDIARLKKSEDTTKTADWEKQNGLARLVLAWANSPEYQTKAGKSKDLHMTDGDPSFASLVSLYTSDVPASTTLDQLLSIGAVEKLEDNKLRLKSAVYYPADGEREKLGILGSTGADIYGTINHNLQHTHKDSRYQSYVYYDNLPDEVMDKIRKHANEHAQEFLVQTNKWLQAYDRDSNPTVAGTGRNRAGLGVYFFENPVEDDEG